MGRLSAYVRMVICVLSMALAEAVVAETEVFDRELGKYRLMLNDDPWANPAHLDIERGERLWKTVAGPNKVTLEGCDFGKGPGVVDGAFAGLPRYFADASRVMDVETRILWCRRSLQGIDNSELLRSPHPEAGAPVGDVGAIAVWIASRSRGLKFAAPVGHRKEQEALALGESLFYRRMGPLDFACATCHADTGKRIRLQPLPDLAMPEEAGHVVGAWPAYRVSSAHVMTMQHRIFDCFWQMRLHRIEMGSEVTNALISYLTAKAQGGEVRVPGMKR